MSVEWCECGDGRVEKTGDLCWKCEKRGHAPKPKPTTSDPSVNADADTKQDEQINLLIGCVTCATILFVLLGFFLGFVVKGWLA